MQQAEQQRLAVLGRAERLGLTLEHGNNALAELDGRSDRPKKGRPLSSGYRRAHRRDV